MAQAAKAPRVPPNVTRLRRPPGTPEPNPAERPWRTLRQDDPSHRAFADHDERLDVVTAAWNRLTPEQLKSIMATDWLRAA